MKHRIALMILWLLSWALQAQQREVSFVIKNFGINVDGHFNRSSIDIALGPEGAIAYVKGIVYVKSVETGIESRDAHILKEDYFDATGYPEITLESTAVQAHDLQNYDITANLMMKGTTQVISFKATLIDSPKGKKFQSEFEINRQDFNIGGGGVLGKTVRIQVTHYLKS